MTLNFFFPPKDFHSDIVTGLSRTLLRHVNIGEVDLNSLVDEEKILKITNSLASYPRLDNLEIRVTGSTSNGWQHHERTLASISYTKPEDDLTPALTSNNPALVTFTRNTQGAREISEIITDIVRQSDEGIPKAEMQARAEWMALRGMVDQSGVSGRAVG
jgi:hypothetical protein